jgi:hypothetical protein
MLTLRSHTHLQATQANAQPKLTNKYAARHALTDRKALAITAPLRLWRVKCEHQHLCN